MTRLLQQIRIVCLRVGGLVGRRFVLAANAPAAHPYMIVGVGALLALIGGLGASRLTIDADFAKLIPADYESVKALDRLKTAVGGESEAAVVIESPSFEANRRFAEDLIPRVLATRDDRGRTYFTRVDYRKDISFLKENALYLATEEELDSLERYLNEQTRTSRLAANPFYFELEDADSAVTAAAAAELKQSYLRLVGTEYPISEDSTVLVLRFYPGGTQTDIDFIDRAYSNLQDAVDALGPSRYDAEMDVVLAGRLLRQLIEVRAITDDARDSVGAGIMSVLFIVTLYFGFKSYQARAGRRFHLRILLAEALRAPAAAAAIGLPLIAALCWTFGTAYLVYGSLNLMTSTLGLILFGLGIDYGIHFYGRYSEERGTGKSVADAVAVTASTTGKAVAVTALTTAAAFFVLMIADFRGFSEFGFIAGTGILYALIAMSFLLPALVVLFERLRLLNLQRLARSTRTSASRIGGRFPQARGVLAVGLIAVGLSVALLPRVSFEYDFGRLDPAYAEYQALQQRVRKVYDDRGRRNPAYIVVDDARDVEAIHTALDRHAAADSLTPTIGSIESLQGRFPLTREQQQAKLGRIAAIRGLLEDPFLSATEDEWLGNVRRAASTEEPIHLGALPEFVRAPFTMRDGSVGRLVVIYPSVGLSDGRQSMAFADDVAVVQTADGAIHHAGSTALVAADMLRLMRREAPMMVTLTLLVVVVVKLMLLRSARLTALAMLPLVAGFLAMFGLIAAFGVKLNFYNLIVLPVVLGIGDDAGIHVAHRYREEGPGSIMKVLRSTGEHIGMSALTTIVGFGGLLLSFYPGLRSIGILALLGITSTLVSALVGLPALLQWLEDRRAARLPVVEVHPHSAAA